MTKSLDTVSGWLLDQIELFNAAQHAADSEKARDVFLQVVNRCAQEGHFRELVNAIDRQTVDRV